MIRIAICDDMHECCEQLRVLLAGWCAAGNDTAVEEFDNGDALIEAHSSNPFDIILLDIIMPLQNGLETAAEIRRLDRTVKLIFISSSREYALDSYSVKADNYLLKPVCEKVLFDSLDEALREITEHAKSILVRQNASVRRIPLTEIEYVEAQGKTVMLFLADGSSVKSNEPLYIFEEKLLAEDGFLKCHRSYIVNVKRIDTYTAKVISMKTNRHIPISRNLHKDFENTYFDLLFGKAGDSFD